MSKPKITISIRTSLETESKVFGRDFIQYLLDLGPDLLPEFVSNTERFKDPFVNIDNFMEIWWATPAEMFIGGVSTGSYFVGPLWKRKSPPKNMGTVDHGSVNIYNQRVPSHIFFDAQWQKSADFVGLFKNWVRLSKPDTAMIHLFTDHEKASIKTGPGRSFSLGVFGGPANPGIPNMAWAMAFDERSYPGIDWSKISAAGFPIERIGDAIVVKVTNDISDVEGSFDVFSERRRVLKNLFGPNFFKTGCDADGVDNL